MPRGVSAAIEIGLIVLLCGLVAGSPTPSVNEAHYLAKAKHYWNPSWCTGDFFLESADAHVGFYWAYGWVTGLLSLPTSAWLGRLLMWSLFAISWRTLVRAITWRPGSALASAAVLLPTIHFFHLSGEWLIGGVEAKGLAWPLVFWGMAQVARGRWWLAWSLFGLASSFHILVGGWAVVAALLAWGLRRREDDLHFFELAWLVPGGLLALPGLLPALALTSGVSAEEMREASYTYSFRRLSHHLVFYCFIGWPLIRFSAITYLWWRVTQFAAGHRLARVQAIVVGSLVIAGAGAALDILLGPLAQSLRASLMRYYWFRTSDVMVPLGFALGLVATLQSCEPLPRRWLAIAVLVGLVGVGLTARDTGPWGRSTAIAQQNWTAQFPQVDPRTVEDDWTDACRWIRASSEIEEGAVFLSPPRQQTFKWLTGRPEVATWKDVPQDARALNAWWERFRQVNQLGDWPWQDLDLWTNIVEDYGVTHVIWPDPKGRTTPAGITPLYRNPTFCVFACSPEAP